MTHEQATELLAQMAGWDNEGQICDEVEVDELFCPVEFGITCTKENCNCVGGWMQTAGNHFPSGQTKKYTREQLEKIVSE